MSEFKERQINQIMQMMQMMQMIKLYKTAQLELNKLVLKLEAVIAFNEMADIRKKISEKVAILEEINAYLIDGGQSSQAITVKIDNIIGEIENDVRS
jgi:DNA integrity scanning protein DisA with diadenylate cyclase activity